MKTLGTALTTLVMLAPPLYAQDTTRYLRGSSVGVTVAGWFVGDEGSLPVLAFHVSELKPRHATVDVSVGVIMHEGFAILPDLGIAYNAAAPNLTVMPRAAVGAAVIVAEGGSLMLPGFSIGSGFIARVSEQVGIRIDVGSHWYLLEGEFTPGFVSLGFGITSLADRR